MTRVFRDDLPAIAPRDATRLPGLPGAALERSAVPPFAVVDEHARRRG